MIMSRLRRPTSKSMTAVFLPRNARPTPIEAAVVVLPTPPFPEVTTMILANGQLPYCRRYFKDSTRSEEHTSELQSLMRISYAVFCLTKKKIYTTNLEQS